MATRRISSRIPCCPASLPFSRTGRRSALSRSRLVLPRLGTGRTVKRSIQGLSCLRLMAVARTGLFFFLRPLVRDSDALVPSLRTCSVACRGQFIAPAPQMSVKVEWLVLLKTTHRQPSHPPNDKRAQSRSAGPQICGGRDKAHAWSDIPRRRGRPFYAPTLGHHSFSASRHLGHPKPLLTRTFGGNKRQTPCRPPYHVDRSHHACTSQTRFLSRSDTTRGTKCWSQSSTSSAEALKIPSRQSRNPPRR